ncbi:MAG: HIT domain-containing protein [Akkermansiaceae bacterium]|jgi:diadenosine tetraphosphate (Ap4A) HIT family hydrolase|nr:HIT domain-containing protein [Akkermansiaceae bacterium]
MEGFVLHPRLAQGSFELGRESGCRILLKDQSLFPWILIVPEVPEGVEDLHELAEDHYHEVTGLIRKVSKFMADRFGGEKLNVGCIGNMVRQMHIHVISRRTDDPAWPGTVWAYDGKAAWPAEEVEAIKRDWEEFAKPG